MNSQIYYTSIKGKRKFNDLFCPQCIKLANSLQDKVPEVKFVITSSYRIGRTIEEIRGMFTEAGFTGNIIGKTLDIRRGQYADSILRGNEILQWVKDNEKLLRVRSYSDYNRYVIWDDDSDMLYWQRNNFMCIDAYSGITPKTIYKSALLLNSMDSTIE